MSAPAPPSTGDWDDILEPAGARSRSMTTASRKRTLTGLLTSSAEPAETALPPSSSASSKSATKMGLAEYYTRCKKVAEARVEDMVRRHHEHRAFAGGRVDPQRWKLLKEKNHMACYRRIGKSAPGHVPDVLATGAIPGALEDVLHGVVNLSTEAMQIENAYAERDMVDNRVLATLVAPTVGEPFRSVTIKWVLRNHEELSRHRDYVYLEATGTTTAPDGDRVGFHLMHSVSLPSAPAFAKDTNIVRGQLSVCYVFRQQRAGSVEVFFAGNINPQGNTRARPALVIAVDTITAAPTSVQCAMMKKLALSLRTKPPPAAAPATSALPQTRARKNTITSFMRANPEAERQACAVCRRSLRFFGKGACALCASVVCGRCRVAKKLFTFDHGVFDPVKMDFCTECVVATNTMSSAWAAARELELAQMQDDLYSSETTDSLHKAHSGASSSEEDAMADEERYTMSTMIDYNSIAGTDRSSRIWMPSDRVLRPTADILAPIQSEPEEEEGYGQPAFFAEEDEGDVFPIIEMPSDDEGDDFGPTNHAVDLVILYKP